jgi:hypothetical protein
MNTHANQEAISKYFMDYTNEFNVPMLLLHHYRKGDEGKSNVRGMNAFRGSAKIIHNADTVIVGHRPFLPNATLEDKAKYTLVCCKDREFGEGGNVTTYFYRGEFVENYKS